jgi:hypothetical protein
MYYHVARATNIIAIQNPYVSLFNKNNYWKYTVETTYNEGGGLFGLAYGVKDAKNYNLFLINGNSDFMIVSIVEGKSEILLKGNSEKINKGKGAKNILTIQNDQNKYVNYKVNYYVNGSDVTLKTDKEESLVPKKTDDKKYVIDLVNDPLFNKSHGLDFANASSIGLFSAKGSSVAFDNIILKTKPNKGRMIMMNNTWADNEEEKKYLNPIIKNQEKEHTQKYNATIQRRIDSVYNSTKAEIANLSLKDKKRVVAEVEAVVWLKDVLFNISTNFTFYYKMELITEKPGEKVYKIKHSLPNMDGPAQYIGKSAGEGVVNVLLGKNLDELQAKKLVDQYISNLLASNVNAKFLDGEPANKDLHFVGVGYGRDFISNYNKIAYLLPKKNDSGNWDVVLKIEYSK